MASRDKDEANIEEVSSGVRYEKGNCVVLNGMSEPDLISKAGVKSGVHGSAQNIDDKVVNENCLLYTSPSPRDQRGSRMPSSA